MIQEYLNAQFIVTTDDANFGKLQEASEQVVKILQENKSKISAYTLVALDPQIKADDPIITDVKNLIVESWRTFIANSKDTTLTIIRAVILQALDTVSKDDTSAYMIWFAGRNVLKYYKLGREKELLTAFLLGIGNKIEKEIVETWSFPPEEQIDIPEIDSAIINKIDLEVQFKTATLAKGAGGENTSLPYTADAIWATFFSTRISKGIQDVLNKAFRKQAVDFKKNQQLFYYKASLLHMRTQLLWWKEAGYSKILNDSYSNVNEGALPIVLAEDYALFIPALYPVSVDYFLRNAYTAIDVNGNTDKKISELLVLVEQQKEGLKSVLPDQPKSDGRASLLTFIYGLAHGHYKVVDFEGVVGVSPDIKISASVLTVWLFHDLTSLKLLK
jgi:hypothetical protein